MPNVIMPEMGEGIVEGTVARWLKKAGDLVVCDEPLLEVETDKVTVQVMAETEGVLSKVAVLEGETVPVGTVLAVIGDDEASSVSVSERREVQEVLQPIGLSQNGVHISVPVVDKVSSVRVSPVVARMLQMHDIDVSSLDGSGRDGRITKDDVLAYLARRGALFQDVLSPSVVGLMTTRSNIAEPTPTVMNISDELLPLTGMRRAIADHMVKSKHISPHVTTVFEFDFSAVTKHRAAHKDQFIQDGVKLTYLPYLVLATTAALKNYPIVNASWTDEGILLKRDINMGIAVAVSSGLIVPVIKQVDSMNLLGLARAINHVSERARANQLKPDEVKGGTFTISNHGTSGSLIGTPIINQPQVGILGIGMIEKRLKVIDDAIVIRPCGYISFSFDHRILDGASADAFVVDIKNAIENFN